MITIERFDSASTLQSLALPFLLQDEAQHNLLLGLLSSLTRDPSYYGPLPSYFAAARDGDEVIAVAAMTPPRNLIVSACESDEALLSLARDVLTFRPATPGVSGPTPVSLRFAEMWQALTGAAFEKQLALRIYRLDRLTPPIGVPGTARLATEEDVGLLTEWHMAFAAEALPHEVQPADEVEDGLRRRLQTSLAERGFLLWQDPQPVSLAGYGGPTPHSLRIGPVYTPPEFRRRGYGSAVTAATCDHILKMGRYATLFTDLANPTSNHIYKALGFHPVYDVDQFAFSRQPA